MKKFSLFLVLLAGVVAFGLRAPRNAVAEAVAMSMGGGVGDCLTCIDNYNCRDDEHQAWRPLLARPNWSWGKGPHVSKPCFPGSCKSEHSPACELGRGGTFAMVDMDRLRGSIAAKDAHAVKDLLADHTESTALNVERSAVQVMDCEGTVIAHFPVGKKLLDRVSAE